MTVPAIAIAEPVGPAGAPLLVLGPSLGTSAVLWGSAARILCGSYRVAAWDLPGHGHSAAARSSFTTGEIAFGVLEAVTALGEDRFRYAGVSLGGAVGLELMLAAPQRVEAAVVLCSGATIGTPDGWVGRAAAVRAQGTASLVESSARRWFAPGSIERRPDICGRLLHSLRDADDVSYAHCAEALASYDLRGKLADIGVPVLAAWGEHDVVVGEKAAEEIAVGVSYGRAARVAGAAHLAPAEQPDAVASMIIGFFEGVL